MWLNHDKSSKGDVIHIPRQQLGFVQKANVFDSRFDCIVGLAYKRMAAKHTQPFLDNIIDKNVLHRNVFSFYLSLGEEDERAGLPAKLVLGKIDVSDLLYPHESSISWFRVVNKDFWAIKLLDVKVSIEFLSLCPTDLFFPFTAWR